MEVTLALLADAANATETKKLNVLGIFSNINPPELPYRLPGLTLVLKFEFDRAEVTASKLLRVVCVDPEDVEIAGLDVPLQVPDSTDVGQPLELAVHLAFNGIRFTRAGRHTFVVVVDGEVKKRVTLNVAEPQTQQEVSS